MANKIACEKCAAFAKHFIDTVVDGASISRRLCEEHYHEFRKDQMLRPVTERVASSKATVVTASPSAEAWRQLIELIHVESSSAVMVVTGGGASAISELLSVPGGSRTLLEAVVPYSEAALVEWLGKAPEQFCVEETALAMAAVAYRRACELAAKKSEERGEKREERKDEVVASLSVPRESFREDTIGVACTASLVSDRPKKGEHRCHVATQTWRSTESCTLVLEKGARDRAGEERLVGKLILLALARAAEIGNLPPLDLLPGESLVEYAAPADGQLPGLIEGPYRILWSGPLRDDDDKRGAKSEERASTDVNSLFSLRSSLHCPPPAGILCGSFHPLHDGHRQLRAAAERILKGPVYYELSVRNVDKPPLDFLSIDRRRAQFTDVPLALTAAPTFAEKAAVLPGVVFVVGVDTAERIVQPKYYGGGEAATREALEQIRSAGCRFLVAGRMVGGRFETLADVAVPPEFSGMFAAIPPEEFRADVSSTQLRSDAAGT